MQIKNVVLAAIMAGVAVAQNATLTIDPNSVDAQTKASWCIGQRAACNTLCDNDAPTNNCDATQLSFECLCADESTPPLEEYKNTLPDYICQAAFAQCIKSRPDDALGQEECKETIQSQCGTKDLKNYTGGSGSGTTTEESGSEETGNSDEETDATGTTTVVVDESEETGTPSQTAEAADATPTGAASALSAGKGFALLAAGIVAALL